MEFHLPFGHHTLTATLPDHVAVDILDIPEVPGRSNPLDEVHSALENLVGAVSWSQYNQVGSVGIAVNDKTRPVPHAILLPPLLKKLEDLGIPDNDVTFYIAVGTHPPMGMDEVPSILPAEIWQRYAVVSHDSEDESRLVYVGETSRGTPVWSNTAFIQSDLKIVVGNIEPHQFAGFSGGYKTAAIGLSGFQTITRNHTLMVHPDSRIGEFDTNPTRQDIEEIGELVGVDLALNAILNLKREIVYALAGDPRAVMQLGIPLVQRVCQVTVPAPYDLLMVSPGGHPKDINIYQAQKGLAHAAIILRPGGTMILTAACPEGAGSRHYLDWMAGKRSYSEVLAHFRAEGFRIGGHKAYLIARDASKMNLMFYSETDEGLLRDLLLNPVGDLQTAIDEVVENLRTGSRVGILPHASSMIPRITR